MMKKIIISFLLFLSIGYSQDIEKGNIKLLLDDEAIEVPIKAIDIRKDNNIYLSIRGENNDNMNVDTRYTVSLEFAMKKMNANELIKGETKISINISRKTKESINFMLSGGDKFANYSSNIWGAPGAGEMITYSEIKTVFNLKKINLNEDKIKIEGEFSGEYSSKSGKTKESNKTVIKNGMFVIIL
jgi:hypothetical protein